MKSTVCLMVKAPTRGKAKTRLAPIFGHAGAALFANALLRDALESWAKSSILIAHTGELSLQLKRRMSVYPCTRQGEGDLGERMERTLRHALLASEVAMAVGTDIPGLGMRSPNARSTLYETTMRCSDHPSMGDSTCWL